jgi:hypothetical protein
LLLAAALEEEDGGTTATTNKRVGQGAIIISGRMSGGMKTTATPNSQCNQSCKTMTERIMYLQLARSYYSVVGWGDGTIVAFGGFQQNNYIPGEVRQHPAFFLSHALPSLILTRALSLALCNCCVLFQTVAVVFNDLILNRPNKTYWRKLVLPHDKQILQWCASAEHADRWCISNCLEHTAVLDHYVFVYILGGR